MTISDSFTIRGQIHLCVHQHEQRAQNESLLCQLVRIALMHSFFLLCNLIIMNLDLAVAAPPAKSYESVFRAPEYRSEFSSVAALTFDSYSFVRTFCTVDLQGEILLVRKSEPETILVAKGWQKTARAGGLLSGPPDGYLSSGFSKYAFRVSCLTSLA